jgi:hypothetical protein
MTTICILSIWNTEGLTLGKVYLTHCPSAEKVQELIEHPGGTGYTLMNTLSSIYHGFDDRHEFEGVAESLPSIEEIKNIVILPWSLIEFYTDDDRAKSHYLRTFSYKHNSNQ